jgi:DNA-binding NarL/FixJ family response regulator
MQSRIVILSTHSLFAEGIASRLRQYPERAEVHFVDPQHPDYLETISTIRPAAVLIDAADTDLTQCCMLCELLVALPHLTVIRLEVQERDLRVFTSVQCRFNQAQDLLDIVEQSQ